MNLSKSGIIKIHRVSQHMYKKQTPWFESTLEVISFAFISASRKCRGSGKNCPCNCESRHTKASIHPVDLSRFFCTKFRPKMKTYIARVSNPIEPRVRRSSDGVSRLNDDVMRRTELATLPNVTHPRRTIPANPLC